MNVYLQGNFGTAPMLIWGRQTLTLPPFPIIFLISIKGSVMIGVVIPEVKCIVISETIFHIIDKYLHGGAKEGGVK